MAARAFGNLALGLLAIGTITSAVLPGRRTAQVIDAVSRSYASSIRVAMGEHQTIRGQWIRHPLLTEPDREWMRLMWKDIADLMGPYDE